MGTYNINGNTFNAPSSIGDGNQIITNQSISMDLIDSDKLLIDIEALTNLFTTNASELQRLLLEIKSQMRDRDKHNITNLVNKSCVLIKDLAIGISSSYLASLIK